jgi:hypothetical protein
MARLRAMTMDPTKFMQARFERGWLELHDSGTFVRFTQSGSDLFA